MLFVSSCAHQTSLNCVCSGAATWTNSATVNQLVYHWIYTLWLISKLIVIIILFRYFSADTFPNRFHFTIKWRKKNWIAQRTRQSPEWKIPHTNARRQTERWIKSETCTNKYSTEKQTNHSKLDKGTCNALKSTLCCVPSYLFQRKTIFLKIIATRNFLHFWKLFLKNKNDNKREEEPAQARREKVSILKSTHKKNTCATILCNEFIITINFA